jgi:hypothetical protein
MLEWKPRLTVLLVMLALAAAAFAEVVPPLNFGWDLL